MPKNKDCVKLLFNPQYPDVFVNHCRKVHDVPANDTTVGHLACGLLHPVTGQICGYRFDTLGNLRHHMGGQKYCLGGWTPATNCCLLLVNSVPCLKPFSSKHPLLKHQNSSVHRGTGCRPKNGSGGFVCLFVTF